MNTSDFLSPEENANKPSGLVISKGKWRYKKRINGNQHQTSKIIGPIDKLTFSQAVEIFHQIDEAFTGNNPDRDAFNNLWFEQIYSLEDTNNNWLSVMYRKARYRALRRDMEFTITFDELRDLITENNGKCALSDIVFSDENPSESRISPYRPSIDRIDSKKGYTKENCRIICAALNLALMDFGEDVFAKISSQYLVKRISKL